MRKNINVSINDNVEVGDGVCFLTGRKRVGTYPMVMRVGIVVKGTMDGLEVEEIGTGKIWKPYSQDIIKAGTDVKGVKSTFDYTEKV